MDEITDIDLVKKSLNGDEESFRVLIDRYKNYVFSIVLSKIKNYEEAENISQEVFLQVFLSLKDYKDDNFKAWIGRISFNKTIDHIRKARNKVNNEISEIDEDKIEEIFIDNKDPSKEIENKELGETLIEILEEIPAIYSETIKKHYIHQKTYEEIAKEERISIKTVETRMYRGRKLIQEIWRDKYETL